MDWLRRHGNELFLGVIIAAVGGFLAIVASNALQSDNSDRSGATVAPTEPPAAVPDSDPPQTEVSTTSLSTEVPSTPPEPEPSSTPPGTDPITTPPDEDSPTTTATKTCADGSIIAVEDECPPTPLMLSVPTEPTTELAGHSAAAIAVDFSPDGTQLVSAGVDGALHVWEVESGARVMSFTGHSIANIQDAVFVSNDQVASTSCAERDASEVCVREEILIWTIPAGGVVRSVEGHGASVGDLDVSSDGRLLASAGRDGTARVWDIDTGAQIITLEHDNWVEAVAFNESATVLATGSGDRDGIDNLVRLWSVPSGTPLSRTFSGHQQWVTSVDFSPTKSIAASTGWGDNAYLWSPGTGTTIDPPLSTPTGFRVVFDPMGEILATGDADNSTRLWLVDSGVLLGTLTGHRDGWVRGVAFSSDGERIATAGSGGQVFIWTYRR